MTLFDHLKPKGGLEPTRAYNKLQLAVGSLGAFPMVGHGR